MAKLAVAVALAVGSFSAVAASCQALGYDELKDMKKEELVAEWCTDAKANSSLIDDQMRALTTFSHSEEDDEDAHRAGSRIEKCQGQLQRIERILLQRDQNMGKEALRAACGFH
ncbi:hypothetical protein [Ralstonia sp.]|uniref:hypothetical protein n=1 Tax=Ralstonia sp. TaxID=54061 RepID=UPI002C3DB2E1|nr:hypothetical protein [Ralstonia sp.]HWV02967.1 hypothetical protein [Ralstonia sp.]